jgi:glycosyltransferase involved in cell wall biosynthesis
VPEVLKNGVTGFVVQDMDEAIAAARRIHEIDRARCRDVFERRFSADTMAHRYLQVYQALIDARSDSDAQAAALKTA